MRLGRTHSKWFMLVAVMALVLSTVAPLTTNVNSAQAQSEIALQVSIPSLWEDTITSDMLAEFEAQHSGVKVYPVISDDTSFFGFGGPVSSIDDDLDSTEEFVTSADVLYVSPTSLAPEDTQAGYFLDLAPLVMSDPDIDESDFIPAVWESFQWDNGMWAIPLSSDIVIMTYDPVAFDNAGLAYPNERWTIDDFAYAAEQLTVYDSDGSVDTPGFSTVSGGNNQDLFLFSLLGTSLYNSSVTPNMPDFSAASASLEYILEVWYEMIQDGVVLAQGGGRDEDIPLRIEGINGYGERGMGGFNNQDNEDETRYATLLPGGVAGLTVQGFAVSSGTQYPELAYDLAKFLSGRSDLASNSFSVSPARYSLISTTTTTSNDPGQGGQPGGGRMNNRSVPDEIQDVVDQGAVNGLSTAETRYSSYLSSIVTEMSSNGGDALLALQTVEALAVSDMQTAQARNGTLSLFIPPPVTGPTLGPGEIMLNCALNQGFGGGMGSQMPNQDQWDQFIEEFVASDPEVGAVNLESVGGGDLEMLTEEYDCIILSSNAVPDADLSLLLNLDPLIDTDTTFDRNDVIGNTLSQLQSDNKTWALPLAITPQMLEYDSEQFAWAGVPEPYGTWTADAFNDALHSLKTYDTDPAPFIPNGMGDSYLLMLIAAYGGLPVDYRTEPATINFTDAATVEAIRQVLDLVVDGYIAYGDDIDMEDMMNAAITTNTFSQFRGNFGGPDGGEDTMVTVMYPQGSQYSVIAYEITTGYISATAQNPEAAYRFLSAVSLNPSMLSGMPARSSLVSDPDVIAAQGEEVTAVYAELDTLMKSPNTIIFPTFSGGGGGSATSFMQSYWLNRAMDAYISDGADLDLELADAEELTLTYLDCVNGIVVDPSITDAREQQRAVMEQTMNCAMGVDPDFGS